TIMSYCHLTGGLSNIDLLFGSTVAGRIAPSVQNAACLTVDPPACGNRILESGEQCDDGNRTSGDCCSATCQAEPCASTTTTSSTSTSTSRPATTSSTVARPSTSTTSVATTSSTTTTTIPPAGDADGDGV